MADNKADSNQDGKAGSSCTECETPPKCFHQYTIKNSKGKVLLDFPLTHDTKMSFLTIIQGTKSETYNFELKGSCQNGKEKCPIALTPDREDLFGTNQKDDILQYSDDYNWSNMTLLQWLKEFFVFDTTKLSNNLYILPVTECQGLVHIPNLFVYPTYKLSIKFAYGQKVSAAKVEDRKARYQYTTEEADKLRNETGKKWSQINKELAKEESSNELSTEVNIGEFKESLSLKLSESERYSDENPIFKITSLMSKVSDSLMSGKGNLGPVRDIQIIGPNLEFSGIKTLKQKGDAIYFEYSLNGGFAPLIGVKAIIDLIDVTLQCINFILPSLGYAAAKAWRELRTAMEKSKKNFKKSEGNGGYIIIGVDLILTGEIGNGTVSVYNDANNKPAGRGDCGGKMTGEVKGYVEGEFNAWVAKGSVNASGSAKTGIGASLLVDPKGIGTRWQHDGAKIIFKAVVKVKVRRKSKDLSYSMEPVVIPLADPYKSEPYYIYEFS